MKNKDLKESFQYILSRQDHFSKFQKKYNFLSHILFIIVLVLFIPLPFIFSYYLKSKIKSIELKNRFTIVRTANGLKIARILKEHNDIDIITLSARGENHFSKLDLIASLFSNYEIYSNYIAVVRISFFRKNLEKVIKVVGFSNLEKKIIDFHRPSVVIQFNDHSPESFYLQKHCKQKNIVTIYVQHAPVSEKFPPLYHDINILFSQDSADKYRIVNKDKKVKIAFDFRFLKGLPFKKVDKIDNSILLCPNLLDSVPEVERTAYALIDIGYTVKVRMHPADTRSINSKILQSEINDVWEDLSTTEIVITNESAIPLEGGYLGCMVYKAAFWSESIDAYGFLRNNFIIQEEQTLEMCIESILKKKNNLNTDYLKYYIGEIDLGNLSLGLGAF